MRVERKVSSSSKILVSHSARLRRSVRSARDGKQATVRAAEEIPTSKSVSCCNADRAKIPTSETYPQKDNLRLLRDVITAERMSDCERPDGACVREILIAASSESVFHVR